MKDSDSEYARRLEEAYKENAALDHKMAEDSMFVSNEALDITLKEFQ